MENRDGYSREIRSLGGQGILNESHLPELKGQRLAVMRYMNDGKWHSGPSITRVAGGSEGLRRMRELRQIDGITIERRKAEGGRRVFEYRMVKKADQGPYLFRAS